MKGVIVHCLEELVTTRFGGAAWQATLKEAGLKPATMFLVVDDIDDRIEKCIEILFEFLIPDVSSRQFRKAAQIEKYQRHIPQILKHPAFFEPIADFIGDSPPAF